MKPTFIITLLGLCGLSAAFADKPKPLPEARINPKIWVEVCEEKPEPKTELIPKMYAEEKGLAIKMESLVRNNGFYQAKFRIINPTKKPMIFTGYSEASPITKTQHWVDGKWTDERRVLRCGTGLQDCTIAPGESAVFQATLQGDKLPSRIGLAYRTSETHSQTTDVWSEKVER